MRIGYKPSSTGSRILGKPDSKLRLRLRTFCHKCVTTTITPGLRQAYQMRWMDNHTRIAAASSAQPTDYKLHTAPAVGLIACVTTAFYRNLHSHHAYQIAYSAATHHLSFIHLFIPLLLAQFLVKYFVSKARILHIKWRFCMWRYCLYWHTSSNLTKDNAVWLWSKHS